MNRNDPYEKLFQRTTAGIKPGLEVISALLEQLGNPHHRLAVIHVAGTNGKGSVCAMLESVLRASGFSTGLYTSPHLVDFSERFRINGDTIPDDQLNAYIERMEQAADETEAATGLRGATFFEISTAIAFQYFADEGVDIAIIETGMGGRWDATNVVIPLVSVITHIDLDHADYLGDTIEQVAAEKAGIIKPGRPVVTAPQSEAVMTVLQQAGEPIIRSDEAVSVMHVDAASSRVAAAKTGRGNEAGCLVYQALGQRLKIETHARNLPPIRLPLLGECQRENCAVAVAVLELLGDLLDVEPEFKNGLESVQWDARFQLLQADPPVLLDGAHNPSAARALVRTLKETCPKQQVGFIFGFLADKDAVEFLRILKPSITKAWTVSIDAPRGLTAEQAAAKCRTAGLEAEPADLSDAWTAALDWAGAEAGRVIVITGSLYLKQAFDQAAVRGG